MSAPRKPSSPLNSMPFSTAPSASISRVINRILQTKISADHNDARRVAEEAMDAARDEVRAEAEQKRGAA